jgi:hypothetical protein
MKTEYISITQEVCLVHGEFRSLSQQDRDGVMGVACMLAFLKGVRPTSHEFSKHLGVDENVIRRPFRRLLINGVFSEKFDARNDPVFIGGASNIVISGGDIKFSGNERTRNAWAIIAGLASGLTGFREYEH